MTVMNLLAHSVASAGFADNIVHIPALGNPGSSQKASLPNTVMAVLI